MCFSAPASFTASTVIGVTGILTIAKVMWSRKLLLALMPLFFAIQQFSEGMVWLQVNGTLSESSFTQFFTYSYIIFAWSFWPFFIPLSVLVAEREDWKKILFALLLFLGTFIFMHDLQFILTHEIIAEIKGNSLTYGKTSVADRIVYGITVMVPLLLSSVRGAWVFGLLVAISYAISYWFYTFAFTSVWCFFSAVASFVLFMFL